MKTLLYSAVFAMALALPQFCNANNNDEIVQVSLSENGSLVGHVFAMMEDEEAPIAGKVTLTADGQTVSTLETDETGNFSFRDVEPGQYNMIGVAGSYIGNKVIEVTPFDAVLSDESEEAEEEAYTAVPLLVAPSYAAQDYGSFGAAPVETFSAGGGCASCSQPSYVEGYSVGGGCSTCGGGCSTCGGGGGGFGGGGGGFGGGGLLGPRPFRRLAIIGGAVGLAVGISSDSSSPDE